MKRVICLFIVFLCSGSIAISQDIKKKVAVYVTGDVESGYKKVIGSKMVSGITKSEEYVAVERTADFLAALAKEQDYQTSGAVNDSQIVRLGQQFGVRFVVVVDVSEIFESLFISARMIDVQTGQIIGAAETNKTIYNAQGLMELSGDIITELLTNITYKNFDIEAKVVGPFSRAYDLLRAPIETGYHWASKEEIEILTKYYKYKQKEIFFPIYLTNYYTMYYRTKDFEYDKNGNITQRPEYRTDLRIQLLKKDDSIEAISSFYTECGSKLYSPSIPSGYIYLIKNSNNSNE